MPLYNPGIDSTGGAISGNLSVGGTLAVAGVLSPADGVNTSGSAPAITPSFSNGTAAQLADTTRDYLVYLQVGTAGSGFTLAIGPTSTPANAIVGGVTPVAGELFSFRLPAGWYVKWAGTLTTLADQIAIGC
jgi:hypothetical protein